MHCDTLTVMDLPVHQVYFFRQQWASLLVASPAIDAILISRGDAEWQRGEGDIDFLLYDAKTDPAADTDHTIDYQFLAALPMPPRNAGETVGERVGVLKRWMGECYLQCSSPGLPDRIRVASAHLWLEFDSFLSKLVSPSGRRVRGMVSSAASGEHVAALVIPIFASRDEDARRTLTDIAMLYAKTTRCPWDTKAHTISAVGIDLHIALRTAKGSGRGGAPGGAGSPTTAAAAALTVLTERLSIHMEDGCSGVPSNSYIPLLRSCLDLRSLPQCSDSYQSGEGLVGYVPRLEAALYRGMRESLHLMRLSITLSASFGDPVDVSIAVRDLESGSRGSVQMRGVSYCVVDKTSCCSFMIGVNYYGGGELPSVGVVCNQYLEHSRDSLLRVKIKYPTNAERTLPVDADGFFEESALASSIVASATKAMSSLVSLCQ